jgi:hypothetical protein
LSKFNSEARALENLTTTEHKMLLLAVPPLPEGENLLKVLNSGLEPWTSTGAK